jgi:hypothetical protein
MERLHSHPTGLMACFKYNLIPTLNETYDVHMKYAHNSIGNYQPEITNPTC